MRNELMLLYALIVLGGVSLSRWVTVFGVAIASAAAIRRAVEAGRLVGVPLSPRLYTPLEVILLKDKFRSRLVNTFADFVTEEIGRMGATEKA